MSMQTSAESKKKHEQALIERFGVKIGKEEWDEIQSYYSYWSTEVRRMDTYYSGQNKKIPVKYMEELDRQRLFFDAVRNVHDYMHKQQSRMSDFSGHLADYWVVNSAPGSYWVSYDGKSIQKRVATFQELMGFLALGVARSCWSIEDAFDSVVTECRASKLLKAS